MIRKITDNSTDLTKKGLNFQADSGELIHRDLGQTLDVVGGISDKAKLSDGNIGVVSENGKLNVKLAKRLNKLEQRNNWSNNYQQRWLDNQQQTIRYSKWFLNANNTQIKT